MERKKIIYFGHPVITYDTELESKLVRIIEEHFHDFEVENPNKPEHQKRYREYRKKFDNGMLYFFEEVLPQMDAGIFLPYKDGKLGAGVYTEAEWFYNKGKKIYEIHYTGIIRRLTVLEENRRLSVEETRARKEL